MVKKYAAPEVEQHEITPAGNHPGVLIGMIELGVQPGGKFKDRAETLLTFELPDQRYTYKKNGITVQATRQISQRYTASMSARSNLRLLVEGWRGTFPTNDAAADFDLTQLMDQPCLVRVVHKASVDGSRTYANIASVGPLPKSMEGNPPVRTRPLMYYDLDAPDVDIFSALPKWIKELILNRIKTPAPKQLPALPAVTAEPEFDDSIPF